MSIRAAAVEVDITPALPCEKPGWIVKIIANQVLDPLRAKAIVLDDGATRVAIVSLDVLSVRWPIAEAIRDHAERAGIPRQNVMVAATHTHTGPPVSSPGLATKDFAYIDQMVEKVGAAIARAAASLAPATIAIASGIESRVSFIRRAIMKDGTVKTHPKPGPEIRCCEGVIDPEVGVVAVKDIASDRIIGVIVNFACHPVHDGGLPVISAGWPGVLSDAIRREMNGCVTVFLNGAFGDVHHQNPLDCEETDTNTKERVGSTLAETVLKMLPAMSFDEPLHLAAARQTIQIPLRDIDGPFGEHFKLRQRFAPDDVYDFLITKLRRKKRQRDHALAEVQAIRLNDRTALVALPCEPFSAIGFEVKSRSRFPRTYVVGGANGMIGYVPTRATFERGGYETTLSMGSKLDPAAAAMLTDAALNTLSQVR